MQFYEFTEDQYETLCKKAMLNDELKQIFKYKIEGYYNYQIAMKMDTSERTIVRRVKLLKKKLRQVI